MKRKLYKPVLESLEVRDIPRASGLEVVAAPVDPAVAAERRVLEEPVLRSIAWETQLLGVQPFWDRVAQLELRAHERHFAEVYCEEPRKLAAPILESQTLTSKHQEGLQYLLNYAAKSVRNNKVVSPNDRDDLVQDIYLEWWRGVDQQASALLRIQTDPSEERDRLRESVYRIFDRYRYAQKVQQQRIGSDDVTQVPDRVSSECSERDFWIDVERWLDKLPQAERQVVMMRYFRYMTMEQIGAEIGLPKQRVSEIHRRAIARHPDFTPS